MLPIVGIDPGQSGALVYLAAGVGGGPEFLCHKMPLTEKDVWDLVKLFADCCRAEGKPPTAVIENVHSSPQMGVSSAFTFGNGLGGVRMALIGNGFVIHTVTPQTWKRAMRCQSPKPTALGKKDMTVIRARAQETYPNVEITNWNADALMIAAYGAQLLRGAT